MEGWVKFLLLETAVLLCIIWEFLSKETCLFSLFIYLFICLFILTCTIVYLFYTLELYNIILFIYFIAQSVPNLAISSSFREFPSGPVVWFGAFTAGTGVREQRFCKCGSTSRKKREAFFQLDSYVLLTCPILLLLFCEHFLTFSYYMMFMLTLKYFRILESYCFFY